MNKDDMIVGNIYLIHVLKNDNLVELIYLGCGSTNNVYIFNTMSRELIMYYYSDFIVINEVDHSVGCVE